MTHFAGGRGCQSRAVRKEWPDGEVTHYEGERGQARRVMSVWPDGRVLHYS